MSNFFVNLKSPESLVQIPHLNIPKEKNPFAKLASQNIKAPQEQQPVGENKGWGSRPFSWIKKGINNFSGANILNYAGGMWIGKVGTSNSSKIRNGVKKALLGNTDFTKVANKYASTLKAIEGNENLIKAINLFSPKISEIVKEKITAKFEGFSTFLNTENSYFNELIRGICYKVVVNFAEYTKNQREIVGESGVDIVKEMIKLSTENFDTLYEEFQAIDNNTSHEEVKKEQFAKLFAPLAEKLLSIALPNGKDDLEITGDLCDQVASEVWKVVNGEVLPEILTDAMRLVKNPPHHTKEDLEILNRPGGAALKNLAKFISEQAKKVAPELLDEKCVDLAEAVVEQVISDPENHMGTIRWISKKIKEFVSGSDEVVQKVWDYSANNIESILLHAFASLAKESKGNVIPSVAGTGLKILDDFLTKNKEKIDREFLNTETLPFKEKQKKRAELFEPLANAFLEAANLEDNDLVKIVKKGALPAVFREFYKDLTLYQDKLPEFKERLVNHLFDVESYATETSEFLQKELIETINSGSEALKVAQKRSGIIDVVEDLSKVLGPLAEDLSKIAREFAESDCEQIADLINNGIFEDYKLSDKEKRQFAEGLHGFLASKNSSLDKTWAYSQAMIEAVMLKVLVTVAEHNPVEGAKGRVQNKNQILASNVMHRILSILVEKIPAIDQQLNAIKMSDKDEKTKKTEIYALFQPLAKDFLEMAGAHIEEVFPVPDFLKKSLREKLEKLFLPAIFNEVYTDLNRWRYDAPNVSSELNSILGTNSGSNVAFTIANYIKDFVPYYMETNPEKVSDLMLKSGNKYFGCLSKEHQKQLGVLIKNNIKCLGEDSAVKEASFAIGEYAQGMILKMFTGVIRNIDGKEKEKDENGNNNFLLTTGIGFIKVTTDYFKRINKIPPGGRNYAAYIVPHDAMLKGFADKGELHQALMKDIDPNASLEERQQQRLKFFFEPFAAEVLEVAGVNNPDDFPVPSPMREQMWKLFKEEILPQVMMNIFDETLKPENINDLTLKIIDTLVDEVEDFNKRIDEVDEVDESVVDDPQQRELNRAMGELVMEVINLVPEFLVKTIFKFDKVKGMTAESLGRIARKKLDDKTLIGYLGPLLGGFSLNKADANRGKSEAMLIKERQEKEIKLNKKLTQYMSKQVKSFVKSFIKSKWHIFQKSFDAKVEEILGSPGVAVKKALDKIFRVIFMQCLGSIVKYTVFKIIWFFVEMKLAMKSKEVIFNTHMPIHENLVYKLCENWLGVMKKKRLDADNIKIIRRTKKKSVA